MTAWSEHVIARAISSQLLDRKCTVLVDNCGWTGHECDVLAVTNDLRVIDVEVKISRADFKADAKKEKWWHRQFTGWSDPVDVRDNAGRLVTKHSEMLFDSTPMEWPQKVWKHYFALPKDIWHDDLLQFLPSQACGVLLLYRRRGSDQIWVECAHRAKPNKDAYRLQPAEVMDIARLANLRMWEAYRLRDAARSNCLPPLNPEKEDSDA
jgi:hypothetical protein